MIVLSILRRGKGVPSSHFSRFLAHRWYSGRTRTLWGKSFLWWEGKREREKDSALKSRCGKICVCWWTESQWNIKTERCVWKKGWKSGKRESAHTHTHTLVGRVMMRMKKLSGCVVNPHSSIFLLYSAFFYCRCKKCCSNIHKYFVVVFVSHA